MESRTANIARVFSLASSEKWSDVDSLWRSDAALARQCSRFADEESLSTFLHLAAAAGQESISRRLVALGASASRRARDGRTASEAAAMRGHAGLASLLAIAAQVSDSLWEPPSDANVLPSSNRWMEAQEKFAAEGRSVAYGGGVVRIPPGARCFEDALGRTLIGWHGTYDPPSGMDGESLL